MEHGFAPPVVRLRCLGYLGAYPLLTDRVAALEVRFVAQSSATLMIGLRSGGVTDAERRREREGPG